MDKKDMKALMVAGMLFFVLLIVLAYVAPYAYHYVTQGVTVTDSSGNETTMTLDDVPGGGIISGLTFVLGLLVIGVVAVIKIFDLI